MDSANCRDPASEKITVLLIESDPEDVRLLTAALAQEQSPGSLQVLNDGEESIAYFSGLGKYEDRVRYPLPSAIVCDLHLPGMSGFDVLAWIREQPLLVTIPIYVLTPPRQPEDIQRAFALGARLCLLKPMTPERYGALARAVTCGDKAKLPPPIRPVKAKTVQGGDGLKRILVGSSSESGKISPHHQYRVRIGKGWHEGAFSKQWFGWNFDGLEPSGMQLNLIDEVFELPKAKFRRGSIPRHRVP